MPTVRSASGWHLRAHLSPLLLAHGLGGGRVKRMRVVPKLPPASRRRRSGAQFLSEVGARLLPPCFHGAPGVEAAPRRTGQNSCADNELAGAPEEIRTPDPQIRRLVTDWRTKVQGAAGDL